jgi:hypothetical protein
VPLNIFQTIKLLLEALDDLANAVDDAFRTLEISTRRFTVVYLQLHLLVGIHNALLDVQLGIF